MSDGPKTTVHTKHTIISITECLKALKLQFITTHTVVSLVLHMSEGPEATVHYCAEVTLCCIIVTGCLKGLATIHYYMDANLQNTSVDLLPITAIMYM